MKYLYTVRAICIFTLTISMVNSCLFAQVVPYISYPIEHPVTESDDINNQSRSLTDLVTASNFYAVSPNALWPVSQLECFYFLADFSNNGDSTANNTIAKISVEDVPNSDVAYTDIFTIGDFPAGAMIDNTPFLNCFTPDTSLTQYTGTYSISSDCPDSNPNNNARSFQFETTKLVFSKETGATQLIAPASGNWDAGEPHSWAFGNYYFIVDGSTARADEAIFSIGNADDPALFGNLLTVVLYKWDDLNTDGNMDPNEREGVASNFYEINGTELPTDLITIPLNDFDTNEPGPIELESGTGYVLMLEYTTASTLSTIFFTASDEIDYAAQVFVSQEIGTPRYAQMVGINGDLAAASYSSFGFGTDLSPVARLVLEEVIFDDAKELLSENNKLDLSPNPAGDYLTIQLPEIDNPGKGQLVIYDLWNCLMDIGLQLQHQLRFLPKSIFWTMVLLQ